MDSLLLEIVTPDRVVLETEADYVSLPGVEGDFGVLPGHIPFFAALKTACMHFEENGITTWVCITGGFAEISGNRVQVLVDAAELTGEIDISRAEAALQRARERLDQAKESADASINVSRAEAALERALTRLHAVKLR